MEKISNPRMLRDDEQNCTERELKSEGSVRNRLCSGALFCQFSRETA